jgi:hypothetical protein
MCANRQTADNAILYKRVVPRTVSLFIVLPGMTPVGSRKAGATRVFLGIIPLDEIRRIL